MTSIEQVKALREETGLSITVCREALMAANGDVEKARDALRQRGSLVAQEKATRTLGAGALQAYVHTNHLVGALVELLCETDFVARNEAFLSFTRDLALHATAMQPRYRGRSDVPEEELRKVREELAHDSESNTPEHLREQVLEGKLNARLREVVFLEQPFLKDETRTVRECIEENVQRFGEHITLGRFVVWKV